MSIIDWPDKLAPVSLKNSSPEQFQAFIDHVEQIAHQHGYAWDELFLMRAAEELAVFGDYMLWSPGDEITPVCLFVEFQSNTVPGHLGCRKAYLDTDASLDECTQAVREKLTDHPRPNRLSRLICDPQTRPPRSF